MSDPSVLADPPERLRPFVRDGRIAVLPAKRSRRRLLLEQVAQAFEPGLRYPERDVDEILKPLFGDHCALRRYLIDEDLLSRTPGGQYWRSGGPVRAHGAGEADVARGAGGADAVGGAQGASDA